FLIGQINAYAITLGSPTRNVERQISYLELVVKYRCSAAPQQSPHTSQQFRKGKWLYQVVVSAQLQAFDAILYAVARCKKEDRRRRLCLSQCLNNTPAFNIGQHDI